MNMYSKTFLVIIIILVVAAGFFVLGRQRQPAPMTPELTQEAALELLELDECRPEGVPEEYRSCTMDISKQQGHWVVRVTHDGFFDDSVKAAKTEAVVEYENGHWVARDILRTHQCWPSRGHQEFSTELCI